MIRFRMDQIYQNSRQKHLATAGQLFQPMVNSTSAILEIITILHRILKIKQ